MNIMKMYLTMVPGNRVSAMAKPEMRVSVPSDGLLTVTAKMLSGTIKLGEFSLKGDLSLNRIFLDVSKLSGKLVLSADFVSNGGKSFTKDTPYTVVPQNTMSDQLLDGCWIGLYHWSEDEARWFNSELKQMTADDWRSKIHDMKNAGITSILIQNVFYSNEYVHQHDMTASTYTGSAMYPSMLFSSRCELGTDDPIEAILSAADECDMTVFPGVGLYAWFDFSPESLEWHKKITVELNEMYGHHPSFYGWYVSEEIMGALYYGYPPVPDEKYRDIQSFFKEYREFVQKLTPTKPVALAPNNIDFHIYKDEWMPILENLDILIPFAFARYEEKYNVPRIAEMCEKTKTHFWVDMEMFKFPLDDGLIPKSYDELIKEIRSYDMLEQIYGYQYTGLMNHPDASRRLGRQDTVELYISYTQYADDILGK